MDNLAADIEAQTDEPPIARNVRQYNVSSRPPLSRQSSKKLFQSVHTRYTGLININIAGV